MDITSTLLGIFGIIISVLTFWITYRQTIGARRERAQNAIKEINKILYRNLIVNNYIPNFEELGRIISSKIVEYMIKDSDMLFEEDFYNTLYTRLIEDEFIESDKKETFIDKIKKIYQENERIMNSIEKPTYENTGFTIKDGDSKLSIYIASVSVLVGTISALVPLFGFDILSFEFHYDDWLKIFELLLGIFVAVLSVYIITKIRTKQTQVTSVTKSIFDEYKEFENVVFKTLKKYDFEVTKNYKFTNQSINYIFDFFAIKNNIRYLIEVKHSKPFPKPRLDRLNAVAKEIKLLDNSFILICIFKKLDNKDMQYVNILKENWNYILDTQTLYKLKEL